MKKRKFEQKFVEGCEAGLNKAIRKEDNQIEDEENYSHQNSIGMENGFDILIILKFQKIDFKFH